MRRRHTSTLSRYTRPRCPSQELFYFSDFRRRRLYVLLYTLPIFRLCVFILYNFFFLFVRVCYYYFSRYRGRGRRRRTSAGIRLRPAHVKLDGFLRTPPFDRVCDVYTRSLLLLWYSKEYRTKTSRIGQHTWILLYI